MREWHPEGAYWADKIRNAWGQPAVLDVTIDEAAGGDADGRLGVFIETFMCESFLLPEDALAFAKLVERTARHALKAERRRG